MLIIAFIIGLGVLGLLLFWITWFVIDSFFSNPVLKKQKKPPLKTRK